MTHTYTDIVDFNFYSIDEDQFIRVVARITTSVVNSYINNISQYNIYIDNHVDFKGGDISNLHVQILILVN
jgi:hypothetical protein